MRRTILHALIFLGCLGWVSGCRHKEGPEEQKKIALHLPEGTPKRPQGSAALTVKPGPQPFTKADVANYFKTHNLPMNMSSTNDFQVDTLEFLTNKDVSDRLRGASPGLADSAIVGLATLRGLFIFTGPPQTKPARFARAYAAFDATSGNLVMIGTLDQGEQPNQPK